MSYSRRALYAAGEPLGDCATRREAGRVIYGGGSDSQSATTTKTVYTDSRSVVDSSSRTDARRYSDSRSYSDSRAYTDSRAYSDSRSYSDSRKFTDSSTRNSNNTDARSYADSRKFTDSSTRNSNNTDARSYADSRRYTDSRSFTDNSSRVSNVVDSSSIAAGKDIALAAISGNSTNTKRLLDTADKLLTGQQKALDISAGLASALASKATGTPDTGVQTQGAENLKTIGLAAAAVAAAYFLKG